MLHSLLFVVGPPSHVELGRMPSRRTSLAATSRLIAPNAVTRFAAGTQSRGGSGIGVAQDVDAVRELVVSKDGDRVYPHAPIRAGLG